MRCRAVETIEREEMSVLFVWTDGEDWVIESSAERYEGLAIAARESRGPLSNSEANEYSWAAECARQQAKMIRGDK